MSEYRCIIILKEQVTLLKINLKYLNKNFSLYYYYSNYYIVHNFWYVHVDWTVYFGFSG